MLKFLTRPLAYWEHDRKARGFFAEVRKLEAKVFKILNTLESFDIEKRKEMLREADDLIEQQHLLLSHANYHIAKCKEISG